MWSVDLVAAGSSVAYVCGLVGICYVLLKGTEGTPLRRRQVLELPPCWLLHDSSNKQDSL